MRTTSADISKTQTRRAQFRVEPAPEEAISEVPGVPGVPEVPVRWKQGDIRIGMTVKAGLTDHPGVYGVEYNQGKRLFVCGIHNRQRRGVSRSCNAPLMRTARCTTLPSIALTRMEGLTPFFADHNAQKHHLSGDNADSEADYYRMR